MRAVDYDHELYHDYAQGRALSAEQLAAWLAAFSALLPDRRPLAGLDVGSGTGRFTPGLARGLRPRAGVEPSVRMREVAESSPVPPGVRYLAGSAEDLPVPTDSADYALMFLSWHHVQDKPRAVAELARVLRPGGRLLVRENFSDHIPPSGWWLEYFPRGYEVDAAMFQPLHEVIETFTSAGWRVAELRQGDRAVLGHPSRHARTAPPAQPLDARPLHPRRARDGLPPPGAGRREDPDAPAPEDPATLLTLERRT